MHLRTLLGTVTVLLLLAPSLAGAQSSRVELERIARAMGATHLRSIEIAGSGQADAFTPGPPGAPAPTPANPFSVNLADNITRLGLHVDQLLPLHGRMVPLAELHRAIGR